MLKKLLKYDLKYIYKSQIFLYATVVFCIIIARLFKRLDFGFFIYKSINYSFLFFTYAALFILIIYNLAKSWNRFKSIIYGEESYLTHTLPVSKKEIYVSKIFSSCITLSMATLLAFIVDFIARDFKPIGVFVYFDSVTDPIYTITSQYINNLHTHVMIWVMILLVLITILSIGYYSITLGHQENRNRVIKSIIIGVVLFVITFILNILFYFIIGIFNEKTGNVFSLNYDSEKVIVMTTSFFCIIAIFVYYLLGLKRLKEGIDVE